METTVKKRGRPAKVTRTERPARIPMSGSRKRMHIPVEDQDPNFHYAWIADSRGRVQLALRAGYEFVSAEEMPTYKVTDIDASTSPESRIAMKSGETMTYMMKQPMEFWTEDQETKNKLIDDRESGMKQQLNSGQEGTYGEVKID